MQMHALGASPSDIQDAVTNKYASQSAYATPTPPAPRGN